MTATNPFLGEKRRPLVVGHRGVPALHQENTMAGFRRAQSLGIDAVELDVRLTSDGKADVCHDENLERLTGERLMLSKTPWDQIARLRVRRTLPMGIDAHGDPVVVDYECEERIPLLAEVLDELAGAIAINVEIKLDTPPWWNTRISVVTAEVIGQSASGTGVVVSSFDLRKLRAAKRASPELAVGFCFDDSMLDVLKPLVSRQRAMKTLTSLLERNVAGRFLDAELVGADHTLIGPGTVDAVHRRGLAIGTHTIFPLGSTTGKPISAAASERSEIERLVELGVDWIETDDPERLLKTLAA